MQADPFTATLPENELQRWLEWAEWMARQFHRSSSAVEGRNGYLSQMYHHGRGLTETHQTNTTGTLLEAYLYDNSGNEVQKCSNGTVSHASSAACTGSSVQGYVYNSFNRLSQYNGAITGSYVYDHQGRRIQKVEGTNAYNYLYDGNNVYEAYVTSNWRNPSALYVQAGTDHPLARLAGTVGAPTAVVSYYHQDGIGSVLATTTSNASLTASQRFNAFGNTLTGSGSINQYGYTGREPDASGLIYYRARYYDPNQIRFTQRDPLGFRDGFNRYSYVHNNPVNFNDPNGLIANSISNMGTQLTSYFSSGQLSQTLGDTTSAFWSAVQYNTIQVSDCLELFRYWQFRWLHK